VIQVILRKQHKAVAIPGTRKVTSEAYKNMNWKNTGYYLLGWDPLVHARLHGILLSGIFLWVKKFYQLMNNLERPLLLSLELRTLCYSIF
jgi:hypothetical protein